MWKNRKGRVGAFLDEGSELEGKYTCTGTVMLDAHFRGEIAADDTLIIGEHGRVEATIRATVLVVRGAVVGNVTASERVELKAGAHLTGDVDAPVLVIEAGAVHDGHSRMTREEPAAAPHSAVVVPLKA